MFKADIVLVRESLFTTFKRSFYIVLFHSNLQTNYIFHLQKRVTLDTIGIYGLICNKLRFIFKVFYKLIIVIFSLTFPACFFFFDNDCWIDRKQIGGVLRLVRPFEFDSKSRRNAKEIASEFLSNDAKQQQQTSRSER